MIMSPKSLPARRLAYFAHCLHEQYQRAFFLHFHRVIASSNRRIIYEVLE